MADPNVNIKITAEDTTQAVMRGIQEGFKRVETGIKQSVAASNQSAAGLKNVSSSAQTAGIGIDGLISKFGALAASAATVGAAIKQGIGDALSLERLNMKFKAATGSADEAGYAMQFVRSEAKRLGLDVQTTAESFGRMLIATKNTALEGEGARKIFSGFGTAFTALGITSDEAGRIFMQMSQGINKGKIELEDAKIIAEAGVPIFDMFSQALGKTRPEIMKMISDGQLQTDVYLKVAEALDKAYGKDAEARMQGVEKQFQNMKTELFETSAAFGKDLLPAATVVVKVLSAVVESGAALWKMFKDLISVVVATGTAMFEFAKLTQGGGMFSEAGRQEFINGMTGIKEMVVEQFNDMGAAGIKYHKSQEKLAEEAKKSEAQRLKEAAAAVAANKKASEDYFKLISDEEQRLLAQGKQAFSEKESTVKSYFELRLKAVAKGSEEELKLQAEYKTKQAELEREKATIGALAAVTARKGVLAQQETLFNQEVALVEAKIAKEKGYEIAGAAVISGLKVKQAKDEYDLAQQRISILKTAGQTGTEEYKKSLDAMYKAHASYLQESTAAYKKYADEIKKIDQEIKDFRSSVEDKIRDIKQKVMTDAQKYADDQLRVQQKFSEASRLLSEGDTAAAKKSVDEGIALAGRLAEKKAESNTKLEEMAKQHQEKMKQIDQQGADAKQTDQQKVAAEKAKENAEYQQKVADYLKEQAATQQGVSNAEQALNQFKELGVQIREKEKQLNVDALATLEKIRDMKLDPKNLSVNVDQGALDAVKNQIADLTKDATKTIFIKTVGASGEASYSNTGGATAGFFAGGKVSNGSALQDSVSAMLSKNEWVINNRATGFWGDDFLAGVNAPFSAAGKRLQAAMAGVSASSSSPSLPNLGTINLDIGGGSFPVSAPIDVLSELNTALRRRKMSRPNP